MELDNIKLQTTWNDAAGSLNNNFSKIKQAIAALVAEGGGLDEEQLLEYLVNNGYVTQEWINENGYIKEVTKKMIADSLGSTGNAGKFLMSTGEGVVWADVDAEQATPDWDAAQGEAGYIDNRPFYAKWHYKGNEISVTSAQPITISDAVQIGEKDVMSAIVRHQEKKFVCQGSFDYIDGILTFGIGSGNTISFQKSQGSLTISTTDTGNATIELIKIASPSDLVKLDEIYIPSAIARTTYVDTKAKEAQAAAEQYIQDEVLTDYATTKYVGEREEYIVGYAEGLVNALESDINGRGYLTSAAMGSYATKEDIKNFVTKGSTLEHYGITDAVISRTGIEPYESGVGNRMGYSYSSKGWKVDGPAMVWGLPTLNARLNADIGSGDNPGLYLSIYNGTAYQWAQIVTDKNFTRFGVKAGRSYTGAYDDDPKSANDINYPSMAGFTSHLADVPFPNGNLLTITTNPNLYVGQIAISSGGLISFRSRTETTWTDWQTILHMGNIGKVSLPSLTLKGKTIISWDDIKASGNYLPLSGGTMERGAGIFNGANSNMTEGAIGFNTTHNAFGSTTFPTKIRSSVNPTIKLPADEYDILHSGNFTTFGIANMSNNATGSANDILTSSVYGIVDSLTDIPIYYGNLLTFAARNAHYQSQLIINYKSEMAIRGRDGSWSDWARVVTDENFATYGIKAGVLKTTGSANDLTVPSIAGDVESLQDVPFHYCNILTITTTPHYYVGQLAIDYNGRMATRGQDGSTWSAWRTVLDTTNIASYAISSNGGTINADKYLYFGDASLAYKTTADGFTKLVISGLTEVGNLYVRERIWMEMNSDSRFGFRNSSTGESESISSFSDLKTLLNLMAAEATIADGGDFNNLTTPGAYTFMSDSISNSPTGFGNLLTIRGKSDYYISQLAMNASGEVSTRVREGGTWKNWRTLLDESNCGSYCLKAVSSDYYTFLLTSKTTDGVTRFVIQDANQSLLFGAAFGGGNTATIRNYVASRELRISDTLTFGDSSVGFYELMTAKGGSFTGNVTFNGGITLGGEKVTSWDNFKIKVVEQTATSGISIAPNVLNRWTAALTGTLTINFSAGKSTVANYYMIEFKTGNTVPTIQLPSGITWQGGDNLLARLEPNKTYQISVLNNLAVGGAF